MATIVGKFLRNTLPKIVGIGAAVATGGVGAGVAALGSVLIPKKKTSGEGGLSQVSAGETAAAAGVGGAVDVLDSVRTSIDANDVRVNGGVYQTAGGMYVSDHGNMGSENLLPIVGIGLIIVLLLKK